MQSVIFCLLDQKYPFWANLVQKFQIVRLSWNLVPRQIRTRRYHWWCSVILFSIGKTFLAKFHSKIQNCLLKVKYSNMQNSMVRFPFSAFDWEHPFWAYLVQKMNIVGLNCNLVPRLIRIRGIQWSCSVFPFSTGNTIFGQIWPQNSK